MQLKGNIIILVGKGFGGVGGRETEREREKEKEREEREVGKWEGGHRGSRR